MSTKKPHSKPVESKGLDEREESLPIPPGPAVKEKWTTVRVQESTRQQLKDFREDIMANRAVLPDDLNEIVRSGHVAYANGDVLHVALLLARRASQK